jgi:hypothetical protein
VRLGPIKPPLKAPGIKRLKLKYDDPLSKFGFKFNLRRYIMVLRQAGEPIAVSAVLDCPEKVIIPDLPECAEGFLTLHASRSTGRLGRAVQPEPMKPKLRPPETKPLKLK